MTKIIKNNGFLREKIEQCLDIQQEKESQLATELKTALSEPYITLELMKQIKSLWNKHFKDDPIYLHEMLSKTELYLPKIEPEPRNPELEKRCQQIKARFENEAYQKMVYNVDMNSALRLEQDKTFMSSGYSADFKTIQGQIITVVNAVGCIAGSFFFGYKAVYYSLPEPDINMQMIGGFMLALIVACAEVYFLFKHLNEMDKLEPEKILKKRTKPIKSYRKAEVLAEIKSSVDKKED